MTIGRSEGLGRMRIARTGPSAGPPRAVPSANRASARKVVPSEETSSVPDSTASVPSGRPVVVAAQWSVTGWSRTSVKWSFGPGGLTEQKNEAQSPSKANWRMWSPRVARVVSTAAPTGPRRGDSAPTLAATPRRASKGARRTKLIARVMVSGSDGLDLLRLAAGTASPAGSGRVAARPVIGPAGRIGRRHRAVRSDGDCGPGPGGCVPVPASFGGKSCLTPIFFLVHDPHGPGLTPMVQGLTPMVHWSDPGGSGI